MYPTECVLVRLECLALLEAEDGESLRRGKQARARGEELPDPNLGGGEDVPDGVEIDE
jgi:hypothetical protein